MVFFEIIINCDKHIYANYLYILNTGLKMSFITPKTFNKHVSS